MGVTARGEKNATQDAAEDDTDMAVVGINWFGYAAPQRFYPLAGRMIPWFLAVAVPLHWWRCRFPQY